MEGPPKEKWPYKTRRRVRPALETCWPPPQHSSLQFVEHEGLFKAGPLVRVHGGQGLQEARIESLIRLESCSGVHRMAINRGHMMAMEEGREVAYYLGLHLLLGGQDGPASIPDRTEAR